MEDKYLCVPLPFSHVTAQLTTAPSNFQLILPHGHIDNFGISLDD